MISAKEARKISESVRDKNADMAVLGEMIKVAAEKGKTSIRVPYVMFTVNGSSATLKAEGLVDELNSLGYRIESVYEELQFVDIWVEVSW